MSSHSRDSDRRSETEDDRVSDAEINGPQHSEKAEGAVNSHRDRTEFHPPRSRTPLSSRQEVDSQRHVSKDTRTAERESAMRWTAEKQPYDGPRVTDIFSPPRQALSQVRLSQAVTLWCRGFASV